MLSLVALMVLDVYVVSGVGISRRWDVDTVRGYCAALKYAIVHTLNKEVIRKRAMCSILAKPCSLVTQ